jgi:hypothetical protein
MNDVEAATLEQPTEAPQGLRVSPASGAQVDRAHAGRPEQRDHRRCLVGLGLEAGQPRLESVAVQSTEQRQDVLLASADGAAREHV